jgi:signal transduction histidine kinase
VAGIFELYSDYTPLLKRIQDTQWLVMIVIGGVLSLLYGTLQLIVRHADRVIKAQGRQLSESVVALKQTRNQLEERVAERTLALEQRNRQLAKEVEDRKRMEQQIIHQEKMAAVGSLAAGIVHEIGNPIAALMGLLQSISTDAQAQQWSAALHRDLALAQEQAQRLAGINRDVSEFATPDAEHREWVDFNNLVARTCRLMRYDSRVCNLDLRLQLESQLPALQLVGNQMVQVLMNLLSNAADALDDHAVPESTVPQIRVETFVEAKNVGFRVLDNGCGMSPETRAQATDAFYTTKPVGSGSGLGLSICHAIITAHRGTLIIESEPGQGTCVTVRLPLPDADLAPAS